MKQIRNCFFGFIKKTAKLILVCLLSVIVFISCSSNGGNSHLHSYGDWYVVEAPTCEVEGTERRDCKRCEHYEVNTIDATGHSYSDDYFIDEKGHWSNPICEHNDAPSNKENHDYVDGVCVICGYTKEKNDYITFTLSDDETYYIVSYWDVNVTDIVIPDYYNKLPVKVIDEYAFMGCNKLESVTIPNTIISINAYAFSDCTSLKVVTFKDNSQLNSIKEGAFYNCSSLKSIIIPNGVTNIGVSAFSRCSSLTTIVIPSSVKSIGEAAFSRCSSLTIYCEASYQPNGWDSNWNISGCPIYWGINENTFIEIDGVQYVIQNEEAIVTRYVGNDGNVVIPFTIEKNGTTYNVIRIGSSAFYNCSSLTSIVISNSVTSIGYRAFYNCSSLISITIPNSVTSIEDAAFSGCSSLTSIEIPNTVSSIGGHAFSRCVSLTSIVIPSGVISVGGYAFYNCSSLTIYCEASYQPVRWSYDWNYSNCPVVWGYKGN